MFIRDEVLITSQANDISIFPLGKGIFAAHIQIQSENDIFGFSLNFHICVVNYIWQQRNQE